MKQFENKIFKQDTILLDGHEFKYCKFIDCLFIYEGWGKVGLSNCEFMNPDIKFTSQAGNTLFLLHKFYNGLPEFKYSIIHALEEGFLFD